MVVSGLLPIGRLLADGRVESARALEVRVTRDSMDRRHPENADGTFSFDVLILDASYKQSLASARSLGRAGLRVAMGECTTSCPPPGDLPAFHSRYSARDIVLPSYARDSAGFGAAVVEFVHAYPTRVIITSANPTAVARVKQRYRLSELGCVLALAADGPLAIANHKARTLQIAHERLSFLSEELCASIATRDRFPIANRAGGSTIPGLYFAGAHTAVSLGPGMRFVTGTHCIAAVLARSVARRVLAGREGPLSWRPRFRPIACQGSGRCQAGIRKGNRCERMSSAWPAHRSGARA